VSVFRDRERRNATIGILGIFLTGIFLVWFPTQVLRVPMPQNPVHRTLINGIWQTLMVIVMPYAWAAKRLGRSPSSLGLTRKNLGKSVLLGCALYSLALAAFISASHTPLIQNHPIRHLPPGGVAELGGTMCLVAAGTDVATRGFILLTLVEVTNVPFAVVMQNIFWMLGHTHEIRVIAGSFGLLGAIALNLFLGLVGDSIALRTKSVVGLAVAHALLNVAMITYMLVWL
jgi:Type II CAAX prenyl endopeptidase Rce1-like